VGLQFPSDGQGFRLVDSSKLAYYQTKQGKLDPWAPVSNDERVARMGGMPTTSSGIQTVEWDGNLIGTPIKK
jgi:hypothetical protein